MKTHLDIITASFFYSFLYIWVHFGVDKLFQNGMSGIDRYNEFAKDKKYLPSWCDYCLCFWSCIMVCFVINANYNLYFTAPISAVFTHIILKRHYG